MAESDSDGWNPSEWSPLETVFVRVKNQVGYANLAAHDLRRALVMGRVKAMVRSLLWNGNSAERSLTTEFWKTASLTANIIDQNRVMLRNRNPVTPDSDDYWSRGYDQYIYLRKTDVDTIWPDYNEAVETPSPAPGSRSLKNLIVEEVERRLVAGELKGDEPIGKVAQSLHDWIVENRLMVNPPAPRTIENNLRDLKMWPPARK
jgi:hypothetical protein